jgi:hypothetical protein
LRQGKDEATRAVLESVNFAPKNERSRRDRRSHTEAGASYLPTIPRGLFDTAFRVVRYLN